VHPFVTDTRDILHPLKLRRLVELSGTTADEHDGGSLGEAIQSGGQLMMRLPDAADILWAERKDIIDEAVLFP
jgi:hypothetical protein